MGWMGAGGTDGGEGVAGADGIDGWMRVDGAHAVKLRVGLF